VTSIENLIVTQSTEQGAAAAFQGCKQLKVATGSYEGFVDFSKSGVRTVRKLTATGGNFTQCPLEDVPHGFPDLPNIGLDPGMREKLRTIESQRAAARQAMGGGKTLEF
jgi:hypothetical protein